MTYAYDALGRRVQRTSTTSGTTKFVYDGTDVVRDLDGSGNTIAAYLNGPGIDNKLRQTANGTVSYFINDHLGTTRVLADSSGLISSSLSYGSYGNVTSGSASTRYLYTGRETDSDIGLIYYRARFYDPEQGRFISEDPVGLEGGINLFAYVENNPLRFTDPSGLCPQTPEPCDRSIEAVNRAARNVTSKVNGARVGILNGSPVINFPDDYLQTIDKLDKAGYYSGILAFNPFDHSGGYEFRTYGSPGFHFKVVYANVEETHEGGRLGVRIARDPAIATDLHIDCNNPVGAGLRGTISHTADFIRYHTPSWLPPLIFPHVIP